MNTRSKDNASDVVENICDSPISNNDSSDVVVKRVNKKSNKNITVVPDYDRHLQSVVRGNFIELVPFATSLMVYMTHDMPTNDMVKMSRHLGLRGAEVLYRAKELCDEESERTDRMREYVNFNKTIDYALLFGCGYFAHLEWFRVFSIVLFAKMLIYSDIFVNTIDLIESNRFGVYCVIYMSQPYSIIYSALRTLVCICIWELKTYI